MHLGFMFTIDFRFTSLMMILLSVGLFYVGLAEVVLLKNLLLLAVFYFCEVLEKLLTWDFLRDLLERWLILEFMRDLFDSYDLWRD
jgi:hypothetical protein